MLAAAMACGSVTATAGSMAAGGTPRTAASTAAPAQAGTQAPAGHSRSASGPAAPHAGPLRGAVVVGIGPAARAPAKALARLVYGDPALHAPLDEATARALVGEGGACNGTEQAAAGAGPDATGGQSHPEARTDTPAARAPAGCTPALREIRDTVGELAVGCTPSCGSWTVSRQLLAGLGLDLGVDLVVTVEVGGGPDPGHGMPVARVLRVAERRFVPIQLNPQQPGGSGPFDWSGSLPVLRSLLAAAPRSPGITERSDAGPAPTKSTAVRPTSASPSTPAQSEPDEQVRVLSSPWFWGGLGVLVAAGVTVFALSRSSLGSPSTVQLDGRVSP